MINDLMLQKSTILAGVFKNYSNLVNSFRGSKYYQKFNYIDSVMCIISNMSTWNVLFKNNHIFAYEQNIENRANFPNRRNLLTIQPP